MKLSFHEPTSNIGFFPLSKHPVRKKEGSTNVQLGHPHTWAGAEVLAPQVQPGQLRSAAASSLQHRKKQFSAQIYPVFVPAPHTHKRKFAWCKSECKLSDALYQPRISFWVLCSHRDEAHYSRNHCKNIIPRPGAAFLFKQTPCWSEDFSFY